MVPSIKYLSDFLHRKDIWTISGFYALCLTLFLFSFPRSWSLYPLGAFLFFGLMMWMTHFNIIKYHFKKELLVVLPIITYFILHFIFFLFDAKWSFLEDKLMFLLIPVFGYPLIASDFFKNHLRSLFFVFLTGIIFICLFQIARALIESISFTGGSFKFEPISGAGVSRFNWEQLSSFEHPTYLGMKILWAISIVLFAKNILIISPFYRNSLILVFSIFLFFLSARISILILGIVLIYFSFYRIKKLSLKIIFILATPLLFLIFFTIANMNKRVNDKVEELHKKVTVEKIVWQNIDPRTRSWSSAFYLIKEFPFFGVGLDVRDHLTREYRKKNYTAEADLRLNAHNQFLETQLTFGIIGTAILFWMLITPILRRKKVMFPELISPFLIIISLSMMFESILVRQWGIMFFVIFYCILTIPEKKPELQSES